MINFLKFTKLYALVSIVIITIGLYSIFTFGYRYSIDFTGGTLLEYQISKNINLAQKNVIQKIINKKGSKVDVKGKVIFLRLPMINEKEEVVIRDQIKKIVSSNVIVARFETVGPSVSREIVRTTTSAAIIAAIGILAYMTFAFKKVTHGLSAVLAMIHDFLILVGTYSLLSCFFGAEFDTLFVTALLTTMSFSVHDTIVVFDKIREYSRVSVKPLSVNANKALTETMVRSINNSLTIILMLIPLTLVGGETIRFFAAALLIGTVTGTYSSPFVATPLLVFLDKLTRRKNR